MRKVTKPTNVQAYELIHEGILALSKVEAQGIRIDIPYCKEQMRRTTVKITATKARLEQYDEVKEWKKKYGPKFKYDSDPQLADILYNVFGYAPVLNENGNPSVDANALDQIGTPVVKDLIALRKLEQTLTTYFGNIVKESVEGVLRPSFNLHTVRTFRSSSSGINFQNIPIRDPEMGHMIRKAFIPRQNFQLVEIDFSGIEVRVAACYHKDPNMLTYIKDPTKDMHRDMAAELYRLPAKEVSKKIRYCGKNMFVFPQFYGSYYVDCAKNLWRAVDKMSLQTEGGNALRDHLTAQGFKKIPQFESHVKAVEKDFWGRRFRVYDQWKRNHWEKYLGRGYVDLLTGFRCSGVMGRNDAINYPVQGAAFHCLLWVLIKLVKWLEAERMESRVIGQIHDSIIGDVRPDELEVYVEKVISLMTVEIREFWDWLIVPLDAEVEVSPVDGSWAEKQKFDHHKTA